MTEISSTNIGLNPESGIWRSRRQDGCGKINTLLTCALFAMGIVSTLGILPTNQICGSTIGLGSAFFLTSLASGLKPVNEDFYKKKNGFGGKEKKIEDYTHDRRFKITFDVFLSIALITIGVLAMYHYVPSSVLGWATIVPIAIWQVGSSIHCCCGLIQLEKRE